MASNSHVPSSGFASVNNPNYRATSSGVNKKIVRKRQSGGHIRQPKPHVYEIVPGSSYKYRNEFPESWFIEGKRRIKEGRTRWHFYPPEDSNIIASRKKALEYLLENQEKTKELIAKAMEKKKESDQGGSPSSCTSTTTDLAGNEGTESVLYSSSSKETDGYSRTLIDPGVLCASEILCSFTNIKCTNKGKASGDIKEA